MERFIRYEDNRDVLFIFGAGASISEGVPLQRDLLRLICSPTTDKELNSSDAACLVRMFLCENFDISNDIYPHLNLYLDI